MPVVQSTIQRPGDAVPIANVVVEVTLVGAGGGPVEGFVTATDVKITGVTQLVTNASGTWSTTLVANSLITPANTVYKVVEKIPDDEEVTFITVPTAAGPHALADIQTDPPGALTSSALAAHIVDPSAHGGGGTGTGNPMTTVVAETSYGLSTAVGTSGNFSRGDHSHGSPPGGVATTVQTETAFDLTSQVGVATTFAREDHRHGTPATPAGGVTLGSTVTSETAFAQAAAAGSASTASKSDHTHGTPPKPTYPLVFQKTGTLSVGSGTSRLYLPFAATIVAVTAAVSTPAAGASLVFDVNYSATSEGTASTAYTTQSNRPTIVAGNHYVSATLPNTTALAAGSYLTVDIDQVGSTTAGSGAVVTVWVTIP